MADGLPKLEHPFGDFCQLLSSVAAGPSGGWMGTPEEPQNGHKPWTNLSNLLLPICREEISLLGWPRFEDEFFLKGTRY